MRERTYAGLADDLKAGISATTRIVLDARVFGLIDEDEDCKGWLPGGMQALYDKVTVTWDKYGCLPSGLPDDLARRHAQIYQDAIKIARANGWSGSDATDFET